MNYRRLFSLVIVVFTLSLVYSQEVERFKIEYWNLKGGLLHPRVNDDGDVFVSAFDGRIYEMVNETYFKMWKLKNNVNGIAVKDKEVYGVYDGLYPFMLDAENNMLYEWNYNRYQHSYVFFHAFYYKDNVYFAGNINHRVGIIGIIDTNSKEFYYYNLSKFNVKSTQDVFVKELNGNDVVIFSGYTEDNKGIIGLLYENGTTRIYHLPDIFGDVVKPNGIYVDEKNVYIALMEAYLNASVVVFSFDDERFRIYKGIKALHIKPLGRGFLVSMSFGNMMFFNPKLPPLVMEPLKIMNGESSIHKEGPYTTSEEILPEDVYVEKEYVELTFSSMDNMGLYGSNIYGAHDFYKGYVATSNGLYYMSMLTPKVMVSYDESSNILKSWVEPSFLFNGDVLIEANGKPIITGNNLSIKIRFYGNEYNITASYIYAGKRYQNSTIIENRDYGELLDYNIYEMDNGYVVYAKSNYPGSPIKINDNVLWTDNEGEFIAYYGNYDEVKGMLLRNNLYLMISLFGIVIIFSSIFLKRYHPKIKKYNKKKYYVVVHTLGTSLIILGIVFYYFYPEKPISFESIPEGNYTLSVYLFSPPKFFYSNVSVYVNGNFVGKTNPHGMISLKLDKGVYNITFKSGTNYSTLIYPVIKSKTLVLPYDPFKTYTYSYGGGINGFSIPSATFFSLSKGESLNNMKIDKNSCDMCALKAYMVASVVGESCRLCSLKEGTLWYASAFGLRFAQIKNMIESCYLPTDMPSPSLASLSVSPSGNNYAITLNSESDVPTYNLPYDGIINEIIDQFKPSLPCEDLFNGLVIDPSKEKDFCMFLSCAEDVVGKSLPFSCECARYCAMDAINAIRDAYISCVRQNS